LESVAFAKRRDTSFFGALARAGMPALARSSRQMGFETARRFMGNVAEKFAVPFAKTVTARHQ